MELKDVKVGMTVKCFNGNLATVHKIGPTKLYGPFRCVCVRYADGTREYYYPGDLEAVE
jgi:hypothetical protein